MSRFTKENPFEFEGIKVWRNTNGRIFDALPVDGARNTTLVLAHHAFIEAERAEATTPETWAYTNEDETEARKGRFVVVVGNALHADLMRHDDLGLAAWYVDQFHLYMPGHAAAFRTVHESFRAWRSAREQPDTSLITDEQVAKFKAEWERADHQGDSGNRVRRALAVALSGGVTS
jgi:hypothetical protein